MEIIEHETKLTATVKFPILHTVLLLAISTLSLDNFQNVCTYCVCVCVCVCVGIVYLDVLLDGSSYHSNVANTMAIYAVAATSSRWKAEKGCVSMDS